jgi:hypothetical protein
MPRLEWTIDKGLHQTTPEEDRAHAAQLARRAKRAAQRGDTGRARLLGGRASRLSKSQPQTSMAPAARVPTRREYKAARRLLKKLGQSSSTSRGTESG